MIEEIQSNDFVIDGVLHDVVIRSHEIPYLLRIDAFAHVAEKIAEEARYRHRRRLMVDLFAKAVCRARGHTVITTDYTKCGHFQHIGESVFKEVNFKHVIFDTSITDETANFEGILKMYARLLKDQFRKGTIITAKESMPNSLYIVLNCFIPREPPEDDE